jgi:hypothetical protein
MTIGEIQTPHPLPDNGPARRRGGVRDWSRSSGSPAPAPFNSYDPRAIEDRQPPPASFVRSLSIFLGDEMAPVQVKRDEIWHWNMHPGSYLLTLPWPRHWVFRRKGAPDDDGHPFRDHVIVGSWKIPPGPLSWWIAAAEATAYHGLSRERIALRVAGEDPSWVPRGFKIALLPPELNWMEPQDADVQLLIAGSTGVFPALNPRAS